MTPWGLCFIDRFKYPILQRRVVYFYMSVPVKTSAKKTCISAVKVSVKNLLSLRTTFQVLSYATFENMVPPASALDTTILYKMICLISQVVHQEQSPQYNITKANGPSSNWHKLRYSSS